MKDFTQFSEWMRFKEKLAKEKECILWLNSRKLYKFLQGIWASMIIYSPYTPLSLKKRIGKMYDESKMVMLSKSYVDSKNDYINKLMDEGFLIICLSEKSPKKL